MPSIPQIIDVARPVIAEAVAAERRHVLEEVVRMLDRSESVTRTRRWCEANLALLDVTDETS